MIATSVSPGVPRLITEDFMTVHALAATSRSPGIHRREHTSVLAAAEKRLLIWMARRLPPAINADHLTALGAAAMVGVAASFAAAPLTRWALVGVPIFLALTGGRVRGQSD